MINLNFMRARFSFIVAILFSINCFITFGQSKADMQLQIDRLQKSLDSCKAVIANNENIIENRDRSIRILQEDVTKVEKEKEELNGKIRQKNGELIKLRSQNKQGEAKKMTLSNSRATLTVPAGKYWSVNQFMCDFATDFVRDSTGNMTYKNVHVFLQAMNGKVLTDLTQKMLGPQIYSSSHPEHCIQFPILLTENTTFSIIITKGHYHELELFDGTAIVTYFEKDK